MTEKQRHIIADLERVAREDGLEHDLEAAKSLARNGLPVETIEGMMRGMFSKTEIVALLAEAKATRVNTTT